MKLCKIRQALQCGGLLISALATLAGPSPQPIPMTNTFEAYAPGTPVTSLTNDGWDASSNTVVVQTNVVWTDSKAVQVPGDTVVSNAIQTAVVTNVWTDFNVCMTPHTSAALPPVNSNAVAMVYLSQDGYLMAYDRSVPAWMTFPSTVWRSNVAALTNGQWAKVSISQNYQTHQCAIFLNGQAVKQQLPFVSNADHCASFKVIGGEMLPSYLDNIVITRDIPASLSNDWNGDSLSDAQEIQTYGYIATVLNVGTGQFYNSIQTAFDAALARDTLNVHDGSYTENVTVAHAVGTFTGGVVTIRGALNLAAGVVLTSQVGFVCGDVGIGAAAALRVIGTLTASNITFSGAGSLWAQGGVVCTNLNVGAGFTAMLTNLNLTAAHLAIGTGARLVISNGIVSADGLLLTGSFTIDDQWGLPQGQALLPLADDFEIYPVGTALNSLGFHGWGATDNGVVVETNRVYGGTNAVEVGGLKTLSNRVNAAVATNVWTDFQGVLAYSTGQELSDPRTNALLMAVMNSNGYISVYNRTNATWEVCQSNVWREPVAAVTNGQWIRLSVYSAFETRQCALFLDGVLLREKLSFINTNADRYARFSVVNDNTNAACVDNVSIGYDIPVTLTNDVDHDGWTDAREIVVNGSVFSRYNGSVFKFR